MAISNFGFFPNAILVQFLMFIKKIADMVYIPPNWKTKTFSESVWQLDQESNLDKCKTWSWAKVYHASAQPITTVIEDDTASGGV